MRTRPQPRHTTRTGVGGGAIETIVGAAQYIIWAAPAWPGAIIIMGPAAWLSPPPSGMWGAAPRMGGMGTILPDTASVTNIGPLKRCGSCDDWRIHASPRAAASPWADRAVGAAAAAGWLTEPAGIAGRCANAPLSNPAAP
eukprot:scaffold128220_cov54-Phaeocystis_antarctica.AAC.1